MNIDQYTYKVSIPTCKMKGSITSLVVYAIHKAFIHSQKHYLHAYINNVYSFSHYLKIQLTSFLTVDISPAEEDFRSSLSHCPVVPGNTWYKNLDRIISRQGTNYFLVQKLCTKFKYKPDYQYVQNIMMHSIVRSLAFNTHTYIPSSIIHG